MLDLTDGIGCLSRCGCRLWSCRHEFLLGQGKHVKEGLHRGLAKTPASLMRLALVVFGDPGIEIGLQPAESVKRITLVCVLLRLEFASTAEFCRLVERSMPIRSWRRRRTLGVV